MDPPDASLQLGNTLQTSSAIGSGKAEKGRGCYNGRSLKGLVKQDAGLLRTQLLMHIYTPYILRTYVHSICSARSWLYLHIQLTTYTSSLVLHCAVANTR